MSKKIFVFSDGTGNSAAMGAKTNVWRLYQALDLTQQDQVAMFDDGVGTSTWRVTKYLGLICGFGLKRNVLDLYQFICRNYKDGDKIYAFGFSRGAFTIRVLAGLIAQEGLATGFANDEELRNLAHEAYGRYHSSQNDSFNLARFIQWCKSKRRSLWKQRRHDSETESYRKQAVAIEFLGLWDTVGAYGLPIQELTTAWDKVIWPLSFRDITIHNQLPEPVVHARQALSLDDERVTFTPIPWAGDVVRHKQVWFAGAHANVGGGYADDGLAYVPLVWMLDELQNVAPDVRWQSAMITAYKTCASYSGRLYDEREGLGMLYRYAPRNLRALLQTYPIAGPMVHHSVLFRMFAGNDYVPLPLPDRFQVAYHADKVINFGDVGAHPESPLLEQTEPASSASDERTQLDEVLRSLATAKAKVRNELALDYRALVGDAVWLRRQLYFGIVAFLLFGVIFPWWAPGVPSDTVCTWPQSLNGLATAYGDCTAALLNTKPIALLAGILSALIGWLGQFVPEHFSLWTETAIQHPITALALLAGLAQLYSWSRNLKARTNELALAAWGLREHAFGLNRQDFSFVTGAFVLASYVTLLIIPQLTVLVALVYVAYLLVAKFWGKPVTIGDEPACSVVFNAARYLRRFSLLRQNRIKQGLAVVVVGFGALAVVNHLLFSGLEAGGWVCSEETRSVESSFATADPCTKTKAWLEAGHTYQLSLRMEDKWGDANTDTDLRGFRSFPGNPLLTALTRPFLRHGLANYFQPVARIGTRGNDDYVLEPSLPFSAEGTRACILSNPPHRYNGDRKPPLATSAHMAEDCPLLDNSTLVARISAKSSGRLFLYVNDVALIWPGNFYKDNRGTASFSVNELDSNGELVQADRAKRTMASTAALPEVH